MNTVKLAICGGGVIGRRHAGAISEVDGAELAAIADPAPGGKALADDVGVPLYTDLQALLDAENDVRGVIVSTPTEYHFEPTMTALNAGCNVLVEKPIMPTLEQAEQIVAKEQENDLHVLVGHHRRYYGLVEEARRIVQSGELGKLVCVSGIWNARKDDPYYNPDWRKRRDAGPLLTNMIHEMDSLRYICGEIESISAEVSHEVRNWEKEDAAAMVMRFASGAIGTFIVSDQANSPWAWEFATGETVFFPRSGQNAVRFIGTEASLDFPNLVVWHNGDQTPDWNHVMEPRETKLELENAYYRQIKHFAAVINGTEEPVISAKDATATLRATLAVFDASSTGQRIAL
ncbi:MAG: Gfo/Idh/MocA family oxidoreductase [Rhodospirillaceae bacterium]|jgi:predicted dehydrogenase|nr:Gfo/Idh/MocA family oxidoreductase [Rhodospirillaceae bacterium]